MDTNRDFVFLVRHIVRISFVCVHLCATRVTLRSVLPLEWESMKPIIFLFIYFLFFYQTAQWSEISHGMNYLDHNKVGNQPKPLVL